LEHVAHVTATPAGTSRAHRGLYDRQELAQARHGAHGGVGAAAGTVVTSAAVSTGVGVLSELSQTVEGDAKHTAEEIAKVLKKFFAEQGWISSEQAK